MINVILSCSQQSWNKCVMGDTEEDHTFVIAKKAGDLLKKYECNVLVISKDITGTQMETLQQVADASNAFATEHGGASFHLDIHTDGGYTGSGATGIYYSQRGKEFIKAIYGEVSAFTPWQDMGLSYRNLFVLRKTIAISGLIELSFHDNMLEAKHIHERADGYAEAIVRGIVSYCGLKKKPEEVKKPMLSYENNISPWALDSVKIMQEKKLMVGDTAGNFNPKNPVTREELAVILVKLMNQK